MVRARTWSLRRLNQPARSVELVWTTNAHGKGSPDWTQPAGGGRQAQPARSVGRACRDLNRHVHGLPAGSTSRRGRQVSQPDPSVEHVETTTGTRTDLVSRQAQPAGSVGRACRDHAHGHGLATRIPRAAEQRVRGREGRPNDKGIRPSSPVKCSSVLGDLLTLAEVRRGGRTTVPPGREAAVVNGQHVAFERGHQRRQTACSVIHQRSPSHG